MSTSIASSLLAPSGVSIRTREQPSGGRRALMSGACVCVPATLCVLLVIFSGTLAAAIVTWRHYTMLRDHDRWLLRGCTVLSTRVREDTSPTSEAIQKKSYYRAEANVIIADIQGIIVAFWGRDGSYIVTLNQATSRANSVKSGAKVSCWSRRWSPRQVSIIAVPRQRVPAEDLYLNMAWGSSFFATISGALVVAICSNYLQCGLFGVSSPGNNAAPGMHDNLKHPVCLTSAQAKYVMRKYGEMDGATTEQWTCSICLEDDERGTVVRKITLPCKHRYHARCLRRWLRRGAPTCPLCNWNVQNLFDANGAPVDETEEESTESAVGLQQVRSIAVHMEQEAVTELNDIAGPHPVSVVEPSPVSTGRPP